MKEFPPWSNGDHISTVGRERVVCGFRFMADDARDRAQAFTSIPLETFHDGKSWCYGPKEQADG